MRHLILPVRWLTVLALAAGGMACSPAPNGSRAPLAPRPADPSVAAGGCAFPSAPTVVLAQDGAVLQVWEVEESPLWSSLVMPSDSAFTRYRRAIEEAGAAQPRPEQRVPDAQRGQENWRRELHNVERAYSTEAGTLRPVRCLDALLFATQNARHPQLDHPTEFLASILQKRVGERVRLRVYFGAGDELFPPKEVYGFDQVEQDVADGWAYVAMLHNHTIQTVEGQLRLGVPAPSVSDVQVLNGLVERAGLAEAWVTNGIHTVVIRAAELPQYLGPE